MFEFRWMFLVVALAVAASAKAQVSDEIFRPIAVDDRWVVGPVIGGGLAVDVAATSDRDVVYLTGSVDYGNPLLARSSDGGASYQPVTVSGLPYDDIWNLQVDFGNPMLLYVGEYRSLDGGATWEKMALVLSEPDFARTYASRTTPCFAVATDSIVLRFTSTCGAAWLSIPMPPSNGPVSFAMSHDRIYASEYIFSEPFDYGELHATVDLGHSWTSSGAIAFQSGVFPSPYDSSLAIAGGSPGYLRTTDGGVTWPGFPDINLVGFVDVEFSSTGAVVASSLFGTGVYESSDFGVTWDASTIPLPGRISVHGQSGDVHATSGFYRRGGEEVWQRARTPILDRNIESMIGLGAQHETLLVSIRNRGLFRSDDEGASWRHISEFSGNLYPHSGAADCLYLVQRKVGDPERTLHISCDRGDTFQIIGPTPPVLQDINVGMNPGQIAGLSQGAIVRSVNSGLTWDEGVLIDGREVHEIFNSADDPDRLYATVTRAENNRFDLFVSPDFGESWTSASDLIFTGHVYVSPHDADLILGRFLFPGTQNSYVFAGILDGEVQFQVHTPIYRVVFDPASPESFALMNSVSGTMLWTSDAGDSFLTINPVTPSGLTSLTSVGVLSGARIHIPTSSGVYSTQADRLALHGFE